MLGRKEMNLLFEQRIETEIDQIKGADNSFNIAQVQSNLTDRFRNFRATTVKMMDLIGTGIPIVLTDELRDKIDEAGKIVPFLDFDAQVQHHIKRYDERRKLKVNFKRAKFIQCEFSLYDPNANLVLAPNVRVKMEVASLLQCKEAWGYCKAEKERIIKSNQEALDYENKQWKLCIDSWVPGYNSCGEVATNIFGFKAEEIVEEVEQEEDDGTDKIKQ